MVSLIQPGISRAQVQPCDVQARGITGTQLDILGEQDVKKKFLVRKVIKVKRYLNIRLL